MNASREPYSVDGSELFICDTDDETGKKTIKQNKKMVDDYRMSAGYYAVFTTDDTKAAEELVRAYYELLFLDDYYNDIRSRAWEWVGFNNDYKKVMEGMLLILMFDDMMGQYWLRRISHIDELKGVYEREILRQVKDIRGEWKDGSFTLSRWITESKIETLNLLGYDKDAVGRYAAELCNTEGYFDIYDRWLDGEG